MEIKEIGLDRTKMVLDTIAIDLELFKGVMEKGEKAKMVDVKTGEVFGVSKFELDIKGIATDDTDNYRISLSLIDRPCIAYILDVNIPKLLYNTNERNANNLEHLSQVNTIVENLLKEHGIFTDISKARVSNIEVNINNDNSKLYDCFKLIKRGMLEDNDKVFQVDNKKRSESLMIRKTHLKIKVYDKVQQLIDTQQLVENTSLIRLEVSTSHKQILNMLSNNSATLDGIIGNWERLQRWFIETIDNHIKKPCDRFCDLVIDEMVEQLKQGHKTYDVLALQCEKGNMVDIDLFAQAMKRYYKEVGKKSPSSIIKNTKMRYEKINKKQYDSLVGNKEALDRLWLDLGLK